MSAFEGKGNKDSKESKDSKDKAKTAPAEVLDAVMKQGRIAFVDLGATWCTPCLKFAPVFKAFATHNPRYTFLKLDVDDDEAVYEQLMGLVTKQGKAAPQKIPAIIVLQGKKVVDVIHQVSKETLIRSAKEHLDVSLAYL